MGSNERHGPRLFRRLAPEHPHRLGLSGLAQKERQQALRLAGQGVSQPAREIFAYVLFVGTTLLSVLAYRGIPLSLGPVLEASGYLDITAFGILRFKERMTRRKVIGLALILAGILLYAVGL